VGKIRKSLRLT
jgi:integrase